MSTGIVEGAIPLVEHQMFIGGEWVEALGGTRSESTNPYTGRPWASVPQAEPADVDRAVEAARVAFDTGPWPRMAATERAALLRNLAAILRRDAAELAEIETRDNGKLLREMTGQMQILPAWYEYFAGAADKLQGDVIPTDKPNFLVYTLQEPVGVVAVIVPWNSPLLLATFKLAPALATGCTVVLKPSSVTPCSSLAFAKRVEEAGIPEGVFNVVTGPGSTVGRRLAQHPDVNKVAFTGSSESGVTVVQDAGSHMARVSLELGGKSPNIIFADADIDAAVNGAVAGIFAATGQTCLAGSRIIVERSVHDQFVGKLVERAETIKLGDPTDPATEMGPVAYPEQLDRVLHLIDVGVDEGATLATGGRAPAGADGDSAGLFVLPTVLTNVRNSMQVARQEVFGPVACVLPFDDEEEAISLANDTQYGLAAGIWTREVGKAHRVAARIRAGTVWINSYRVLSYAVPFGGLRMSGYGRENGLAAMREYTETKSVWVELSGATRDPFRLG